MPKTFVRVFIASVCAFVLSSGVATADLTTDSLINLTQWRVTDGGNDHWYGIAPRLVIQPQADSLARTLQLDTLNGYLATVRSAEENYFILHSVLATVDAPSVLDQMWIGGYYFATGWYWMSNELWGFTNWAAGEPNNIGRETAVAIISYPNANRGYWNNATPDTRYVENNLYWFVVEFGEPDSTAPPPVDTMINLVQWTADEGGNDHWYAIWPKARIWQDADTSIKHYVINGDTAYLASIRSAAENTFILNNVIDGVIPSSHLAQFWVGGRYLPGTGWIWQSSDESFAFDNWASGEPNNLPNESAIAVRVDGLWNNATPDTTFFNLNLHWSIIEFGPPDTTSTPSDTLINLLQWTAASGGNDHWYAVVPLPLIWQDADTLVKRFGIDGNAAYLATITSTAENAFITNSVLNGVDPDTYLDQLWLGGRYLNNTWNWGTGELFGYANWNSGEPNNLPDESAITIRLNGTWNNATPDTTFFSQNFHWSVIEIGPPEPEDLDTLVNFVEWPVAEGGNGHWYAVRQVLDIWNDARLAALATERVGTAGHLATIGSPEENAFVAATVLNNVSPPSILPQLWIGGYWSTFEWLWVGGEFFGYTNWALGEPNNLPDESAIAMRLNGQWNNATPDESIVTGNRYFSILEWEPCCIGTTGNVNGDAGGSFDLSDLIYLVNYLFAAGPEPPCMAAANIDGDPDCAVDLSDIVYAVAALFLNGTNPAPCNAACL